MLHIESVLCFVAKISENIILVSEQISSTVLASKNDCGFLAFLHGKTPGFI